MRAVVWHGKRDVRVEDVPDPVIKEPTDAVVRMTSSGLCGSDLHLYEVLAQIRFRMGQANVRRWLDDVLPLPTEVDPLGVDDFATHRVPLENAAEAYRTYQRKEDGAIKFLLRP